MAAPAPLFTVAPAVPAGPIVWRSRPKRDPAFTSLSKKRNRTKPKKPAEAKPAEGKPAEAATAAP